MAEGGGEGKTSLGRPTVFVSYASQDQIVADAVCEALERRGIACWIAPRDVTPGEFYADAIVRALNEARILVLVLTENSVASPHVLREIERTSAKRHPIISLRIGSLVLPPALEYFLSASHWLEARTTGIDSALPKLAAAVQRLLTPSTGGDAKQAGEVGELAAGFFPHSSGTGPSQRLTRPLVAIIAIMAAILGYVVVDRFWLAKHAMSEQPVAAAAPARASIEKATPEKSVAVLPFVDMSEKKDQEYFSDGLSEELIDLLTKVPNLRVPARTSAFYFKGKQTTIAEIAKALGVAHVLEGSVRKSGSNLRITVQLIRADNGYHMWSETYDRKLDDIFKIQDEIAGRVLISLKAALDRSSRSPAAGTQNAEAYTLLLQGRALERRASTKVEYENAIGYLQRAITADPTSAAAWAALSAARKDEFIDGFLDYNVASVDARAAAERALVLDPAEAGAHSSMAGVYFVFDWDWEGAAREFKAAYELEPAAGIGRLLADVEFARGADDSTVLSLYQSAVEQDPIGDLNYARLADYFQCTGRLAEAEAAIRKAHDLNPTPWQHMMGLVLLAEGHAAAAVALFQSISDPATRLHGLALAYHALSRKTDADTALQNLEAEYTATSPYRIAEVHAYRGETDQAFVWLDRAWRVRDPSALDVKRTPLLARIRSDPRYKAFLLKMKLPE